MDIELHGDDMAEVFGVAVQCLREIRAALEPGDYLAGECAMVAHSLASRVRCGELPSPPSLVPAADAPR